MARPNGAYRRPRYLSVMVTMTTVGYGGIRARIRRRVANRPARDESHHAARSLLRGAGIACVQAGFPRLCRPAELFSCQRSSPTWVCCRRSRPEPSTQKTTRLEKFSPSNGFGLLRLTQPARTPKNHRSSPARARCSQPARWLTARTRRPRPCGSEDRRPPERPPARL